MPIGEYITRAVLGRDPAHPPSLEGRVSASSGWPRSTRRLMQRFSNDPRTWDIVERIWLARGGRSMRLSAPMHDALSAAEKQAAPSHPRRQPPASPAVARASGDVSHVLVDPHELLERGDLRNRKGFKVDDLDDHRG
jgi:hypothetical protein